MAKKNVTVPTQMRVAVSEAEKPEATKDMGPIPFIPLQVQQPPQEEQSLSFFSMDDVEAQLRMYMDTYKCEPRYLWRVSSTQSPMGEQVIDTCSLVVHKALAARGASDEEIGEKCSREWFHETFDGKGLLVIVDYQKAKLTKQWEIVGIGSYHYEKRLLVFSNFYMVEWDENTLQELLRLEQLELTNLRWKRPNWVLKDAILTIEDEARTPAAESTVEGLVVQLMGETTHRKLCFTNKGVFCFFPTGDLSRR